METSVQRCPSRLLMREITLSRGYVALVDDADYDRVIAAGPWYVGLKHRKNGTVAKYARHSGWDSAKKMVIGVLLHRFIMGVTDPRVQVDHAVLDGLHTHRCNLRIATNAQNMTNRSKVFKRGWASSQFKGVSRCKSR